MQQNVANKNPLTEEIKLRSFYYITYKQIIPKILQDLCRKLKKSHLKIHLKIYKITFDIIRKECYYNFIAYKCM